MLYTLDTNVVSQLLNGHPVILDRLRAALRDGHAVVLNAICYFEIKRGLVLPTFERKLGAFERLVVKHGLLALDKPAIDEAVRIYQDLRRRGALLEDADLLMGAIAIVNGATLVTHNTRHFERIAGLLLTDWER